MNGCHGCGMLLHVRVRTYAQVDVSDPKETNKMGRSRSRIAVPRFGIRLRPTPPRVNHISYIVKPAKAKDPRIPFGDEAEGRGLSTAAGSRVMVVVDSSLDAEGALEWALSHTVQNHRDCIVLLQVVKPFSRGELMGSIDQLSVELSAKIF